MKFRPAPIPKNENLRIKAVQRTGVLDVDNKDLFLVYNELAKQISGAKSSYTGLIDEKRQYFLAHHGMGDDDFPDEVPRKKTLCQYALNNTAPLIVADLRKDDRFNSHDVVKSPPHLVFYAGFPIINKDGLILGTLCVTDFEVLDLSDLQIDLLIKLTGRLAHQLEIQAEQREITAKRIIDLITKIRNTLTSIDIDEVVGFLSVINHQSIEKTIQDRLIKLNLISINKNEIVLSDLGRNLQKSIGLDSGIYRRIIVSRDIVESNLDKMLTNLD